MSSEKTRKEKQNKSYYRQCKMFSFGITGPNTTPIIGGKGQ